MSVRRAGAPVGGQIAEVVLRVNDEQLGLWMTHGVQLSCEMQCWQSKLLKIFLQLSILD
jgi:hypothetical protein